MNKTSQEKERPVRAGVFETLAKAEQAFNSLTDAGFTQEELTVICSNELQQKHFPSPVSKEGDPTSANAAATGSLLGGILGGLTAAAGLATVAGIPVVIAGSLASALTGGTVGGLTGMMVDRGFDKEAADYYDQAVTEGKILIAVEPSDAKPNRLETAAKLLRDAGAEPLSLLEG
ncbi:general stress protein [Bythopirellula goksoeyrii]|uniref:General stress protein 17M-like domain-containing protein n=1 Tax=Bythopirellula goksoeyrii TaxID=1400387 RepID=A0A5B9QIR9_9BACT|nr:general stress protein [Bythopirellula goksoeyrii]QEG36926.1 hypothetical protein Pr1d_42660 [Bythopirellula goksoeyrii]